MDKDMNKADNDRIKPDKVSKEPRRIFNREKFISFLDRQGFYVVLFICICVIGVTALITTGKGKEPQSEQQDGVQNGDYDLDDNIYSNMYKTDGSTKDGEDMDNVEIKVEDVLTDDGDKDKPDELDNKKPDGDNENVEKKTVSKKDKDNGKTSEDKIKAASNPQDKTISGKLGKIMLKPVQGDTIITDYAQDELIYSSTLKEWRTHPAIDIESQLGSEVKAVLDGVVQAIEEDPLMGIVITLDHGEGLITKYANVSTKDMVQIGQYVVKGQVISGVGKTASSEVLDPPHLHFEVIMNGKNVDPKQFFE